MSDPRPDNAVSEPREFPPVSKPRSGWLRTLLYVVIFASGCIVGAGTTVIAIRNSALFAVHHPAKMPSKIAARMTKVLSLSDEQAREVEAILRERQSAIQDIRREFQPRIEMELDRLEEQISAVLDEKQRENWQERFEYLRHTWVPAPPPAAE